MNELENLKIVTSSDEVLIIWDLEEPDSKYFIKGYTDIVTGLCFISGTRFANTFRDKTLKTWK